MNEQELEELRKDELWDSRMDEKLNKRSAEEILDDTEEDFNSKFGEQLEKIYNELKASLKSDGLEFSVDDVFEQLLSNNTGWCNTLYTENRMLKKQVANWRNNFIKEN